jgi:hypothetical protein
LVRPNGQVSVALLVGMRGPELARVARWVVNEHQPRYAVLVSESWTVRAGLRSDDADVAAVMLGELRPSQLPADKRGELLILYGESREGDIRLSGFPIEHTTIRLVTLPSFTIV